MSYFLNNFCKFRLRSCSAGIYLCPILPQIYVLPPMNRPRPFWYHDNYTYVAQSFAKIFANGGGRLFVLPAFECPANRWEPDGTHLTPGEGERYLDFCSYFMHL